MQERYKTYTITQDVLLAIETETSDENLTIESKDTSNEVKGFLLGYFETTDPLRVKYS